MYIKILTQLALFSGDNALYSWNRHRVPVAVNNKVLH